MKKVSVLTAYMVLSAFALSGQEIWFTTIPEWGNQGMNLTGKVNADPQNHRVAGYIWVEEAGGWWTKPSFANPTVAIGPDSAFILDFTTGGLDAYCTRLITFLVPIGYSPPQASGAPELSAVLLENYPYAVTARPHGDRILEWSGFDWIAKRSVNNSSVGPGPNLFSSAEDQVFVDTEGCLHLLVKNNGNGQWLCSEMISDTSLGYGTYKFKIKSRVDNCDLNTVQGNFTWDEIANYSVANPDDFYREYDIEFSRWNVPGNDVGQYVVQPWYNPSNIFRFAMGAQTNTIHLFEWSADTIIFKSFTEDSSLIAEFSYTGSDLHHPGQENVRINLWQFAGTEPLTEQEMVLTSFEFENLIPSPENLIASDGDTLIIHLSWDSVPGLYYGIYRSTGDDPLTATLLTPQWIQGNTYEDIAADAGIVYYYWVRASNTINGSNTSGYSSGFSDYDTGIAINTNTSLNHFEPPLMFKIIPNPNCGVFTLEGSSPAGRCRILILTPTGVEVYNQGFDFSETDRMRISLDHCQGIYFLVIIGENTRSVQKLIVLNG